MMFGAGGAGGGDVWLVVCWEGWKDNDCLRDCCEVCRGPEGVRGCDGDAMELGFGDDDDDDHLPRWVEGRRVECCSWIVVLVLMRDMLLPRRHRRDGKGLRDMGSVEVQKPLEAGGKDQNSRRLGRQD